MSRAIALAVAMALAVAGCTSGGASPAGSGGSGSSPGSSTGGSASPSTAPSAGIDHATGATDLLLRLDTGGGFVGPGLLATQAPQFSLYGDGTAIFRDDQPPAPPPLSGVARLNPFRSARLTEDQIQAVLQVAIGPGGLGVARDLYMAPVADAPSTTFTLNAGGLHKTVVVAALGIDTAVGEDAGARAAFDRLARQLRTFDFNDELPSTVYAPDRYRGILIEEDQASGVGAGDIHPWPWPSLTAADWKAPSDPNAPSLPLRTMSVKEVKVLGILGFEGGFQGLFLRGPGDGKIYSFALRPLLPDETD